MPMANSRRITSCSFVVFFRRQSRIHHRVGKNIERSSDAILRHVDPENRAIERRVGVDVTADVLDFLRDRISARVFVPLKSMCSRMWESPAPRCWSSSMLPVAHHACTLATGAL